MYCTNCGQKLEDGSQFCTACGARLKTEKSNNTQHGPASANSVHTTLDNEPPKKQTTFESYTASKSNYTTPQELSHTQHIPHMTSAQSHVGQKQSSSGKIVAIVIVVIAVIGIIAGAAYFVVHSLQENKKALLAAQDQVAAAQAAAVQAQKDAEDAQAEKDQAKADAEQAQKDAEAAQKEAADAKSDAATQAAIIMAAIAAAQDGDPITYDGYIFPSDREYITEADMVYWDQTMTLLARNEIYARHGYVFQTPYIQDYFASQDWYYPDPSYTGTGLSKVEQANIDTIVAYEKKMGWK